ncbi:MAG: UDP-N-acetylmuramate dehydrogenase [Mycobacteriales bacterium]
MPDPLPGAPSCVLEEVIWDPPADPAAVAGLASRLSDAGVAVQRARPLAPLTTFGVGGPAALFVEPAGGRELALVMQALAGAPTVPVLVLGRGSNLLVGDGGFPGLVLRLGRGFTGVERDGVQVRVGAAYSMPQLAAWTARGGLAGMEFAAAIPASIGGSVAMNAGAHGADVASVLVSVEVSSPPCPSGQHLEAAELALGYRHCELPAGAVVTGARFALRPDEPAEVAARLAQHRAWRRRTQPLRARSCGSTFTNPPGTSAGLAIEAAGGKGLAVGGARVSDRHANFIVVEPGARAGDVLALIGLVRQWVLDRGGPLLVPEVRAVGHFTSLEDDAQ